MKLLYLPNQYSQQRQKEKPVWIYPVRMAMEATYHFIQGHEVSWNVNYIGYYDKVIREPEGIPFYLLPAPDRIHTDAFDKKYQSYGNYKYTPATHMQVTDGCWWGRCSFCVENGRPYVIRTIDDVIEEIMLCERMGFKEIFDDSGTFPDGEWLDKFCKTKIQFAPRTVMGCNMRIGADVNFNMMKQAGFRMVLFGIESANQTTLNRINKGVNANAIIPTIKEAARAGLEPHIACMFGQPGEGPDEENKTLELVHYLLRKGYAKTAQASIYDTPHENKTDSPNVRKIYDVWKYPDFWINKLRDIRNLADIIYIGKGVKKGIEAWKKSR
jgi:radical SAM superfamily enzyme YgiQ (UPF0313 family)